MAETMVELLLPVGEEGSETVNSVVEGGAVVGSSFWLVGFVVVSSAWAVEAASALEGSTIRLVGPGVWLSEVVWVDGRSLLDG